MLPIRYYMMKNIWLLVWPVILEMVGIMLEGILTTMMVGELGAVAVAAVGLATLVLFGSAMVFSAAGTGTAALIARETGAGNYSEVRNLAGQALMLGSLFGLLLGVSGHQAAGWIFTIAGAEPEVAVLSVSILKIMFWFSPWFLVMSIGTAILRGMGYTRRSFMVTTSSNLVAILISYALIYGVGLPKLGAVGTAWGIGISQLVGAALVIPLLWRTIPNMNWQYIFSYKPEVVKRIVNISIPASIEQLSLQGGRMAYTFMLASVGAVQFAGHQIALQVESISFMPGFAFSVAAMTLVGQNLGKKLSHRAVRYASLTLQMAVASMSAMAVLFFLFAKPLTTLFINDANVVYWGTICVMIAALEQPTLAMTFVFSGALRGAGDTKWPMYVTTFGVWLVRIPLIYLFISVWHYDITAAWYITAGDFLIRCLILWKRFSHFNWK